MVHGACPVVTLFPANGEVWDNQCGLTKWLGIESNLRIAVMSSTGLKNN